MKMVIDGITVTKSMVELGLLIDVIFWSGVYMIVRRMRRVHNERIEY